MSEMVETIMVILIAIISLFILSVFALVFTPIIVEIVKFDKNEEGKQ